MADYTINLDKTKNPYYVSADQFALAAKKNKTVQFFAVNAEFSITIWNADQFFIGVPSLLKINITSGNYSQTYTIKDLLLKTEQEYYLYCVDNRDPGDAPPKIIIVP